jgi:hypothetical protein
MCSVIAVASGFFGKHALVARSPIVKAARLKQGVHGSFEIIGAAKRQQISRPSNSCIRLQHPFVSGLSGAGLTTPPRDDLNPLLSCCGDTKRRLCMRYGLSFLNCVSKGLTTCRSDFSTFCGDFPPSAAHEVCDGLVRFSILNRTSPNHAYPHPFHFGVQPSPDCQLSPKCRGNSVRHQEQKENIIDVILISWSSRRMTIWETTAPPSASAPSSPPPWRGTAAPHPPRACQRPGRRPGGFRRGGAGPG